MTAQSQRPAFITEDINTCLQLTFPPVMVQLVQALVAPYPEFSTIARLLSMDPVLAAAVLNLVNSPYFGLSTKVADLQRAAAVLGTREILKLALSLSLQKRLTSSLKRSPNAMYQDWRLVVWSSIAAEQIALRLQPSQAHMAYLASLLKDLALFLVLCTTDEDSIINTRDCITSLLPGQDSQEVECWGDFHPAISRDIVAQWELPEQIAEAVAVHHDLDGIEAHSPVAQAVILATHWSDLLHGNARHPALLIQFEMLLRSRLGLDDEELEILRNACSQRFSSMLAQLGIQDAPRGSRLHEESLRGLQGYYFLSAEVTHATGGLAAVAGIIGRQLRWHWGIDTWELALAVPGTEHCTLFGADAKQPTSREMGGPAPINRLPWRSGRTKHDLMLDDKQFGQLRIPIGSLPETRVANFAVFAHFLTLALDAYYAQQVVLEDKAATLDALPVGVARIDDTGLIAATNRRMEDLVGTATTRQNILALLRDHLGIDIEPEWQAFTDGNMPLVSRLYCPSHPERTDAPAGVYISLHRQGDGTALLLLEDVTSLTELDAQALRQSDFLSRLVDSMQEIVLTLDAHGAVTWASRRCQHLKGRNFFMHSRTHASFTDTWDATYLPLANPATPVEAAIEGDNGGVALFELAISSLSARDHDGATYLLVGRDLTSIRRLEERVKQQAMYDGLTGLFNHSQFHSILEREIERTRRTDRGLCLFFFDLDKFKAINDAYGHQAGDTILKRVGAGLGGVVRKGMDFACRYGGDEFTVVATEITADAVPTVAARIRAAVMEACRNTVGLSLGVAMLTPEDTAETLIQRADKASYRAKGTQHGIVIATEDNT